MLIDKHTIKIIGSRYDHKKDIPKLEKQLDLLIKFKKYLKNYNE